MKKTNVIFAIIISIIVLCIAISRHGSSRESKTTARIVLVNRVLAECRSRDGEEFDKVGCIYGFGKKNDFPEQQRIAWAVDGYGNPLVLDQQVACKSISFCGVYSKGRNGVDECGEGDDIVSRNCR